MTLPPAAALTKQHPPVEQLSAPPWASFGQRCASVAGVPYWCHSLLPIGWPMVTAATASMPHTSREYKRLTLPAPCCIRAFHFVLICTDYTTNDVAREQGELPSVCNAGAKVRQQWRGVHTHGVVMATKPRPAFCVVGNRHAALRGCTYCAVAVWATQQAKWLSLEPGHSV